MTEGNRNICKPRINDTLPIFPRNSTNKSPNLLTLVVLLQQSRSWKWYSTHVHTTDGNDRDDKGYLLYSNQTANDFLWLVFAWGSITDSIPTWVCVFQKNYQLKRKIVLHYYIFCF